MWLQSPAITCTHGFSTRAGGSSRPPFNSLNLGGSDDDPATIAQNRLTALAALSLDPDKLCNLKQVHGAGVCHAVIGRQEGDALVSAEKGLVLAVNVADCYPVLFHDARNQVIGAAHAGWKGTCAGIAGKTVEAMKLLGADPGQIRVAIGPGICREHFEVGPEVTRLFAEAGFPEDCLQNKRVDLLKCLIFNLQQHGIHPDQIWAMQRCTFENDFFSHRRDKGKTGRMWAVISL